MKRSTIITGTIAPERAGAILGVPGRFLPIIGGDARGRPVIRSQRFVSETRTNKQLVDDYGPGAMMRVDVRFDDECRNGHETFAITADVTTAESRRRRDIAAGGCLHDDISEHFPELASLLPWRLTSTDGPMHYPGNAVYLAGDRELDAARRAAVWPDATDEDLMREDLREVLTARLPDLMARFRAAMLAAGFIYPEGD